MKKIIFTLWCIILLLCGNSIKVNAQSQKEILQEYKILERELTYDERNNMPYKELQHKYLKKLEQMKEQLDVWEEQTTRITNADKSKEKQMIANYQRRIKFRIFKLTTVPVLLSQPRNKAIADSLKEIYRMSDRHESNRKSFELLNNYERTLAKEAYQRYPQGGAPRKAALDSVFLIMKALGTIPEHTVKRKVTLK